MQGVIANKATINKTLGTFFMRSSLGCGSSNPTAKVYHRIPRLKTAVVPNPAHPSRLEVSPSRAATSPFYKFLTPSLTDLGYAEACAF
jgi:hypothetical protein